VNPLSRLPPTARRIIAWFGLLGLCAAYLRGGVNKLLDFPAAVGEAAHFDLPIPSATAAATIMVELLGSALVLSGWMRWLGAVALACFTLAATFVANRYWNLPPGEGRFMAANGFFEHLGLVGAFLLIAVWDRQRDA